jgi:hypothetical protein
MSIKTPPVMAEIGHKQTIALSAVGFPEKTP